MHDVCMPHRIPRTWGKTRVKQEEEADIRIIARVVRNLK